MERTINTDGILDNAINGSANGATGFPDFIGGVRVDSPGPRRGRPPGSGNSGSGGPGSGSSGPGRPGRKPGTSAGDTEKKTRVDAVTDFSEGLQGVTGLVAWAAKIEEIEIGPDEAEELAKHFMRIHKFYPDIPLPGLVLAWIGLLGCAGKIAASHYGAYKLRMLNEAGKRPVQINRAG